MFSCGQKLRGTSVQSTWWQAEGPFLVRRQGVERTIRSSPSLAEVVGFQVGFEPQKGLTPRGRQLPGP